MTSETILKVQGGIPLKGCVSISGSKHIALAILGALPLLRGSVKLTSIPRIRDVEHMFKINESLGINSSRLSDNQYLFSVNEINYSEDELWRASQLRSSILYLGSILIRCGHVLLPIPGGDRLGVRPLNEFLYVLDAFGIRYELQDAGVKAYFEKLEGSYEFDLCSKMFSLMGNNRSVLALMLAYANKGTTKMKNILILPEIIHMCKFLQLISHGTVVIEGIGTDVITITSPGLDAIHQNRCIGQKYAIDPDKCEIPFWICASALTRGDITCQTLGQDGIVDQMTKMNGYLLQRAGVPLEIIDANRFRVNCASEGYRPKAFHLLSTQHELNGVAFDACPLFATILLQAEGEGSFYCYRYGFERIRWAKQLSKIGALVRIKKNVLLAEGCEQLFAKKSFMLEGYDIRSASSVLLTALATKGRPLFVRGMRHIERGMEDIITKLLTVGASVDIIKKGASHD